ncbi:hypothetical protein [Methanobrevibacter sp.]|uniref:hypothetical protein n=1 Tax=Methanobrevibacter sp. TaxID=66852 RepID=UPI0038671FE4
MKSNYFLDFSEIDMEELTASLDKSILEEISKRPHIKLGNELTYIKNTYEYFKDSPIRCLNPEREPDPSKTYDGYPFLDFFDHMEFEEFQKESGDDLMESALKFIDAHLNLALKRNDYFALFDSQSSKALYYAFNEDFKNALKEELKLFLVRINPHCDKTQLVFHEGVNQVNIHNLNDLIIACEIEDVETLFNNVWDELEFEMTYFDKKESYDILIESLNACDLDGINCNIERRYFRN